MSWFDETGDEDTPEPEVTGMDGNRIDVDFGEQEDAIVFEPDFDMEAEENDSVNHPLHYTHGKMECIDAIEGLGLSFHEAQILKYIVRWRYKGGVNDLRKARWYLNRLIGKTVES